MSPESFYSTLNKVLHQDMVVFPPSSVCDVTKANRKEEPLVDTLGPSLLQSWLWPGGPGISGTQGGFSDPLPRFQMLVNLPALFLSALSSHPQALRLHSAPYVHPLRERLPRQSSSSN